jgi:lysophospholipase L1-like esterase
MIAGPSCAASTQLAQAESFLAAHRGHVALVTLDIGVNNIYSCLLPPGINTSCVTTGLGQVASQLPLILSGLRAADPGVSIVGMNYYDPFLVYWLLGDYTVAAQSLSIFSSLNSELGTAYASAGASMADVYTAFQSQDYATGYLDGYAEPQDLVTLCTLTNSCQGDMHPNNQGHAVIAGAFYPLLPTGPITLK